MNPESPIEVKQEGHRFDVVDIIIGIMLALSLALFLRVMIGEIMFIPSKSMEPTLLTGDNILVSKIAYSIGPSGELFGLNVPDDLRLWFSQPVKQDIIVFRPPKSATNSIMKNPLFVKRIIAGPRDEHPITGDVIPAKGMVISSSSILASMLAMIGDPGTKSDSVYIVGEDYYYVLGDNRNASYDSKDWGLVPRSSIIGKAVMILWSNDIDSSGSITSLRFSRLFQFCR